MSRPSFRVPGHAGELLSAIASQDEAPVERAHHDVDAEHLVLQVERIESRRAAWPRWGTALLLLVGVGAAAYFGARTAVEHPSAYFQKAKSTWLSTQDSPISTSLSAVVVIELEPWSRLRGVVSPDQASWLLLEAGTATARFQTSEGETFRWDAGPYTLTGANAALSVSWEPHTGTFATRVVEGGVELHGPRGGEVRRLTAGDSVGYSSVDEASTFAP